MHNLEIRNFAEHDVEGFHACLDAVARERRYLSILRAPSIERTRIWLTKGIEDKDIRLILLHNSRIIGWCDIEGNDHEGFSHSGKLGIGLLREYRGLGLGSKLLNKTLITAIERGLERVELDVYASNHNAINLYKNFNFKVEGQKRRARKLNGVYDDIIMMAIVFDE